MTMNEPHTPAELDALDELASAIVDGEAALPADAELVLLERVAAMRAVRSAIAAPVDPPSAAVREAGIAAALGASATSTDVHSLATRRRRMPVLPAAAVAAALALLVAIGILGSGDDAREANVAAPLPTVERHVSDGGEPTPPSTSAARPRTTVVELAPPEKAVPSATREPVTTFAPETALASDGSDAIASDPEWPATAHDLSTEAPVTTFAPETNGDTTDLEAAEAPVSTFDASTIVTSDGSDAFQGTTGGDSGSLRQTEVLEQPVAEAETPEAGGTESRQADASMDDEAQAFLDDSRASAGSADTGSDTFVYLFPHADDAARDIRDGWRRPPDEDFAMPDCGFTIGKLLADEDLLETTFLHVEDGDLVFEALLVVGPTVWAMLDLDTCEYLREPPEED